MVLPSSPSLKKINIKGRLIFFHTERSRRNILKNDLDKEKNPTWQLFFRFFWFFRVFLFRFLFFLLPRLEGFLNFWKWHHFHNNNSNIYSIYRYGNKMIWYRKRTLWKKVLKKYYCYLYNIVMMYCYEVKKMKEKRKLFFHFFLLIFFSFSK